MSRICPITLPGKTINWRRAVRLTNDGLSSPLAINGPDEERIAAASILCGASLIHGWNVQVTSIYKNLWFESLNLDYLAIHYRVDDVRNIDNLKICGYVQAWEIYIILLDAWKWFLSRKCFVECMKKFREKNILFKMLLLRISFQLYSQEHTVRLVVKLVSPPASPEYCGPKSNLVAYAPLLYWI